MSLYIRNCLSQQRVENPKTQFAFKPFFRQRNHLGKIIKRNCLKKVISGEQILESLKIPTEQYFLIKKIQMCQRRYQNWKKQSSRTVLDERKTDFYFRHLEEIVNKMKFHTEKSKDSYQEQIKSTIDRISSAKETIEGRKTRRMNRIIKNDVRPASQQSLSGHLTHRKTQTHPLRLSCSFQKAKSSKKSAKRGQGQRGNTYQIEQYPIYYGRTLQQKKLQRSLFHISPTY